MKKRIALLGILVLVLLGMPFYLAFMVVARIAVAWEAGRRLAKGENIVVLFGLAIFSHMIVADPVYIGSGIGLAVVGFCEGLLERFSPS